MQVWTTEQLRTFLRSVSDDRLYGFWLLIATTGLRRGEALGRTGPPIRPGTMTRQFGELTKRAHLRPLRLHDLRHTDATIALSAGTHPKVVAERLGHATIAVTLDTYRHVIPSLQEEAATRLANLILGNAG